MTNGLDTAEKINTNNEPIKRFNNAKLARSNSTPDVTPIEYAESIRFITPVNPSFAIGGSILSVMSLVIMSLLSTIMLLQLLNPQNNLIAPIQNAINIPLISSLLSYLAPPAVSAELSAWTWLPFLFTVFGATLGWVFELGLILSGTAFQQQKNAFTRIIQQVRFLNIAPVTMTIFFFVSSMTINDPNLRLAMMYIAGAGTFALGFGLFFGGAMLLPLILLGTQVLQLAMILLAGIPIGGDFLIAQAILQFTALVVGTATPLRSTGFHILSTLSGIVLYNAILTAVAANPNYSFDVALSIPAGSLLQWGAIAACALGLVIAVKAFPVSYGNFRVSFSNLIWSPLYFKLVSAARFPDPVSLNEVYRNSLPALASLKPYYLAHPAHLINDLSVPALDDSELERNVTVFSKLLQQAKSAFTLISFLDHNFPQANVSIPITYKQRMTIWSDGQQFWPWLFNKKIFGATLPNNGKLDSTPKAAITAFQEGQLLAYLAEYGVANTFLMPAPNRDAGTLVADFRFLEKYETKPDYESYGGAAYFIINSAAKKLELVSVVAPHSTQELIANPHDPSFRNAERLVLASMYYQVIGGKHLAEIHMTYNLVEVSMHNAFDAQGQWLHPFRAFMYLHFFSQELAEELTTEHLIQDGAVFSQIFATTHDALIQHLNDCYSNFEYGIDEDFEARRKIMTMPSGSGVGAQILPNACINWELEYFVIWHTYTTQLIDIIYADDEAVRNDRYLQNFHGSLLQVLLNGLPARYQEFQTKEGVARFAADTIHHMVIRHQVYGTTGIRAALDPRISQVQVPKDSGTYPVDEWRSLAFVALATGQARFTLLTGKNGKDFTYLLEGVDEQWRNPMAKVFDRLQESLVALDKKWTKDQMEKDFNYDFFRAVPSDLHTGPGY